MGTKCWTFTVIGRGSFPGDMLRYDACYPTDADSVVNMFHDDKEERKINLRSFRHPTEGRWNSFWWRIEDVKQDRWQA